MFHDEYARKANSLAANGSERLVCDRKINCYDGSSCMSAYHQPDDASLERHNARRFVPFAFTIYSSGISISPESISSLISFGLLPSTWHPTLNAVPKISLTVPLSSFAIDLKRIFRAISMISSRGMLLVCLMFFSFLRSRGGSLRALMTSDEAEGTTETAA